MNRIASSDLNYGFHVRNYQNYIKISYSNSDKDYNDTILNIQREVALDNNLESQVQQKKNDLRDICKVFESKQK